jgi:hypothetical protein
LKIKLDENLGERGAALFRRAGHDVETVADESLSGATDHELIDVCGQERRCLVTLDLDFSNPMVFDPSQYAGIAVLRLPPRSLVYDLWDACQLLVDALVAERIEGRLWIVQRGRVREYRPESPQ